MMHRNGLLVLSTHVSALSKGDTVLKILKNVKKLVKSTLYVHLNNAHEPYSDTKNSSLNDLLSQGLLAQSKAGCSFHADVIPFVTKFYSEASLHCNDLDVNVLLHNIGTDSSQYSHVLKNPIQCILVDHPRPNHPFLRDFVASGLHLDDDRAEWNTSGYTSHSTPVYSVLDELDHVVSPPDERRSNSISKSDATVIGGTFDRIHCGHKVLLSEAILLAKKKVVIGVSDGPLLRSKTLKELIQPVEERKGHLEHFIRSVARKDLLLHLETIHDPYGPSIVVPDLDVILVSQETEKGGHMVNVKRKERGLSQLRVHIIGQGALLDDSNSDVGDLPFDETKASSSSMRFRLLGTLLKPVKAPMQDFIPETLPRPYIIGLTGGIAAGKSSVCKRLENLGAIIIDCDKLGHLSYLPGTKAYASIIEHFGDGIVLDDGQINRRSLGEKVFSDKNQMDKLNSIVWPEIELLCKKEIVESLQVYSSQDTPIIVLDAAVLLEAKWDWLCHEVWAVNIPAKEAVIRIMNRNNMAEESAKRRIESQPTNEWRSKQANVVLSTLWQPDVTKYLVEKSWRLLKHRLPVKDAQRSVTGVPKL